MTRDHDLPPAVQVGRGEHVGAGCLGAEGSDGVRLEPEDGRHRPFARRYRLLHQPAALAHAANRIAEVESARRDERRPLAEAVPADGRRHEPGRLAEDAIGAHAHREDRGLGVLGELQHGFGSVEAEARERHAEPVVGLLERAPRDRKGLRKIAPHARALRSLPRKEADGGRRHQTARGEATRTAP